MVESPVKPFQILALSGGGYRGLYTAQVIADIEKDIGRPIAKHFDLIAGTSVGGILALALALEIPAHHIVDLFKNNGSKIFKKQPSLFGYLKASYTQAKLKELLSSTDLFGNKQLAACCHPVIVPSLSYSTGQPVVFKTPHHPNFKVDHTYSLVDIALATSAAPAYFPRHIFNDTQYVDGGLYANSPGILALHEAQNFFNVNDLTNIRLLSIGTMSSRFTVDPRRNRAGGVADWGKWNPISMPKRIFGLTLSAQEVLVNFMLKHALKGNYTRIDSDLDDERARAVALDKTDAAAQEVLLAAAKQASKESISNADVKRFLEHSPSKPIFYYGEQSVKESDSRA